MRGRVSGRSGGCRWARQAWCAECPTHPLCGGRPHSAGPAHPDAAADQHHHRVLVPPGQGRALGRCGQRGGDGMVWAVEGKWWGGAAAGALPGVARARGGPGLPQRRAGQVTGAKQRRLGARTHLTRAQPGARGAAGAPAAPAEAVGSRGMPMGGCTEGGMCTCRCARARAGGPYRAPAPVALDVQGQRGARGTCSMWDMEGAGLTDAATSWSQPAGIQQADSTPAGAKQSGMQAAGHTCCGSGHGDGVPLPAADGGDEHEQLVDRAATHRLR